MAALSEPTHELLVAGRVRGFDMHDELLTTSFAATYAGVTASVVRQWKRRGHLHPAAHDHLGRPLYRGVDVLRAETAAAKNARRTQGENLATRRASQEP